MLSSLRNMPILAIDDEPTNLKLLEKMLRGEGYGGLVLLDDPTQAVAAYKAHRPGLYNCMECRQQFCQCGFGTRPMQCLHLTHTKGRICIKSLDLIFQQLLELIISQNTGHYHIMGSGETMVIIVEIR